ncbi:MAG: tetratricopeptide repeat protein [Candidatus Sumerlaeaceae bacterium]|nr:tetratricopeptide repeat protein [Candidatus Sumerlaeaceae bacterium]
MSQLNAPGLLDEVNEKLDPTRLLDFIGYSPDKIQSVGDTVKAFCPIHRDTRFRSLLIDARKHLYKCTIKTCAGYTGGNLVDLYCKVKSIDPGEAVAELIGKFGIELPPEWNTRLSSGLIEEAERAFINHQHEAAEAAAIRALQFQPNAIEVRLLLANIYSDRGEVTRACEEMLSVADAYLAVENYEEADTVLDRALEVFPDNEDVLFAKVRSAQLQQKLDVASGLHREIAQRREQSGRMADNLGIYIALVGDNPRDTDLRLKLAEVHEMRRDIKSASKELEAAANVMLEEGKGSAAIPVLEKVLQYEPQLTKLRATLVEELVREGEFERAKHHVFHSLDGLLERGDFQGAIQTVRKWLEVEPESLEGHKALARVFQEQGDAPAAAAELDRAAKICIQTGENEQAIELLYRIKFVDPEDLNFRRDLIEVLREAGRVDQALFEWLDMAEIHFSKGEEAAGEAVLNEAASQISSPKLLSQIAGSLRSHGRTNSASTIYLRLAVAAEADGDAATALDCYNQLLDLEPQNLEIAIARCRALWNFDMVSSATEVTPGLVSRLLDAGKTPEADSLLALAAKHGVADAPTARWFFELCARAGAAASAAVFYAVAKEAVRKNDTEAALLMARQLAELLPGDEAATRDIADICAQLGQPTEAAAAHLALAELQEAKEDHKGALASVELAMGLDSQNLALLRRKSGLLLKLKDPEQSQVVYRDFLARLRTVARSEEVVVEYEQYLAANPGDSVARAGYATLLSELGRKVEAAQQYRALAQSAEKAGNTQDILSYREMLLQLEPGNIEARLELAQSYSAAGDREKSVALFLSVASELLDSGEAKKAAETAGKAHELFPDNQPVLELLATADKLRGAIKPFEKTLDKLVKLGNTRMAGLWYGEQARKAADSGDHKAAEKYAARWLEIAPGTPDALELRADLDRAQRRNKAALEGYLAAAKTLRESGEHSRTARNLQKAAELAPDNTTVAADLCTALFAAGEMPAGASCAALLAGMLEKEGNRAAAIEWLEKSVTHAPSPEIQSRLARLTLAEKGLAAALPLFRGLLDSYRASGDTALGSGVYEELVSLPESNPELRLEYAEFLESSGLRKEAKTQYVELARHYRDVASEPVKAIQFLGRASTLNPEAGDAAIFEDLASLHLSVNVPDFAAEALREAIKLYEEQQDFGRALLALQKLVKLPSVRIADHEQLGELLVRTDRPKEARQAYNDAAMMALESPQTKPAERKRLLEKVLSVDPGNLAAAKALLGLLSGNDLSCKAMALATGLGGAGKIPEQLELLEFGKAEAPDNLEIRLALLEVRRKVGTPVEIRDSLFEVIQVASACGNREAGLAALEELASLPEGTVETRELAGHYAQMQQAEKAISLYCQAAEQLADAGDAAAAASMLKSAMEIDESSVPASVVASVVRKSGGAAPVVAFANEALDSALRSRSRTPALLIASALLKDMSDKKASELLKHVFEKAGASFLVAIAGAHADNLLDAGDAGGAIKITDLSLKLAGNSPETWWMASQTHRKAGNKDKSAEASKRAAKLFAETGAVTEEETCYREVLKEFPDDTDSMETLIHFYERERRNGDVDEMMNRLATTASQKGDHALAAKWIERLADANPEDLPLRQRLVEALSHLKRPEEFVGQLLKLAALYQMKNQPEEAASSFERVLAIQPDNEEALVNLLLIAREAKDMARAARYSNLLADNRAESGRLSEACDALKELVEFVPDNLAAHEKLATLYQRAGDLRAYCNALQLIGNKYVKKGDQKKAIEYFEKLAQERPQDADNLQMIVDCAAATGQNRLAGDYAARLLEMARESGEAKRIRAAATTTLRFNGADAMAHRDLANSNRDLGALADAIPEWLKASELFEKNGELAEAAACLQQLTQAAPDMAKAWKSYGDVLIRTGDPEGARVAFFQLAELHLNDDDLQNAEAALGKAIQIDPEDPIARQRAAGLYRRAKRNDKALAEIVWLARHAHQTQDYGSQEHHLTEGLEIDPDNQTLLQSRVDMLRALGRTEELIFRLRDLATRATVAENYKDAAATLEQIVEADPNVLDVRRELGGIYEKLGDRERASREFSFVVHQHLKRGETEEAREIADTMTAAAPSDLALHEKLASAFADNHMADVAARYYAVCAELSGKSGDTDSQVQFLEKAVEARPKWAEGLRKLAEAAEAAKKPKGAASAWRRLEDLHFEQKKLPDALEALKRQVVLTPKDPEPRRRLVDLYSLTGNKEQRTTELSDLAGLLWSRGMIDEAVEAYRQLTMLKPDDTEVLSRYIELFGQVGNELEIIGEYLNLADAYARKGSFMEATQTFEKVLTIDRLNTFARHKFINFLQNAGQKNRAIAEMRRLAGIFKTAGNYHEAVQTLNAAVALSPADGELCMMLAECCEQAGNRSAALASLLKAAAIYSDSFAAKAVEAYHKYFELDPNNIEAHIRFGDLLHQIGDTTSIADNARKLASLYEATGQKDMAEKARQVAEQSEGETPEAILERIESHKDNPKLQYYDWIRLGDCYFHADNIDKALEAFKKARGMNDDSPAVIQKYIDALTQIIPENEAIPDFLSLAERHFGVGDYKKAMQVYEHVLKLDPGNAQARSGRISAAQMTSS